MTRHDRRFRDALTCEARHTREKTTVFDEDSRPSKTLLRQLVVRISLEVKTKFAPDATREDPTCTSGGSEVNLLGTLSAFVNRPCGIPTLMTNEEAGKTDGCPKDKGRDYDGTRKEICKVRLAKKTRDAGSHRNTAVPSSRPLPTVPSDACC